VLTHETAKQAPHERVAWARRYARAALGTADPTRIGFTPSFRPIRWRNLAHTARERLRQVLAELELPWPSVTRDVSHGATWRELSTVVLELNADQTMLGTLVPHGFRALPLGSGAGKTRARPPQFSCWLPAARLTTRPARSHLALGRSALGRLRFRVA
jgi:hypothetical protein